MFRSIHLIAGVIAILLITTFWLATALSELSRAFATIVTVKTAIPWDFLLLIPALAVAGGSGIDLAMGRRVGLVGAKGKRMPLIAANGLLVFIPCALFSRTSRERANWMPFSTGSRRLKWLRG